MEAPIIIFVQAHGGGSDKLDGKFMTFNNYRESTAAGAAQRTTNPLFHRFLIAGGVRSEYRYLEGGHHQYSSLTEQGHE